MCASVVTAVTVLNHLHHTAKYNHLSRQGSTQPINYDMRVRKFNKAKNMIQNIQYTKLRVCKVHKFISQFDKCRWDNNQSITC